MPQVQLSKEDFEEDPMGACEQWQAAMDMQMEARVREAEEALLAQSREALRVTRSPFSTKGTCSFPCHMTYCCSASCKSGSVCAILVPRSKPLKKRLPCAQICCVVTVVPCASHYQQAGTTE